MQTNIFSVKDGTLQVIDNIVVLWEDVTDEIPIATTPSDVVTDNVYTLPSTLIRNQADEELAEEEFPYYKGSEGRELAHQYGFIKGRESVGGEFHLTREQVEKLIGNARSGASKSDGYYFKFTIDNLISSLTPPIYPHTITVQTDHKGNHLWNTLVPEY